MDHEGLVFRLHGKGTFVSKPKAFQNVTSLQGFAQAMVPMGYGVQLVFSDGHDRGIFPWAWLERFVPPAG